MKELYGKFEYDNNNFAFAYKDYIITIISSSYEYANILYDKECDDVLLGITTNNDYIMFFGCKFNKNFFKNTTHITTQGFIILDCQNRPNIDSLFNCISFYSPAINDFYPPQTAINNNSNNITDFSIKLKNNDDCIRKIQIDNYELIFGFYYLHKFEFQSNDLLNCTPYISFKFNKCVGISELKSCYLKLINFLAFINFNNNIPIEKIKISNIKDGKTVCSGICFINSKSRNFDSKKSKAILANFFDDDELVSLFKQTSNYNDIKKHYYIPKKAKDLHSLNHNDLLTCATCFEGLFKEIHPNFKASKNKDFNKVKSDYLTYAKDYLNSSNITKNQKHYAEKFYNLINNYDGLLEEIFNAAFEEHKYEISDFEKRLKEYFKISTKNYGNLYANIRNSFAHGTFFELGNNECFIYELLHALLYAMNLKAASINKEKSKEIINKIFL